MQEIELRDQNLFYKGIFPISMLDQRILLVCAVIFLFLELIHDTFVFIYHGIPPGKTLKSCNMYHLIFMPYPCLT